MVIITISTRNGCGIEHWKYLLPQPKRFVPSGDLNFGFITIQFDSSSLYFKGQYYACKKDFNSVSFFCFHYFGIAFRLQFFPTITKQQ